MMSLYRSVILGLYKSLHGVGVIHVDVEPRHVRKNEGEWRLIDFEAAIEAIDGRQRGNEMEMAKVELILGYR